METKLILQNILNVRRRQTLLPELPLHRPVPVRQETITPSIKSPEADPGQRRAQQNPSLQGPRARQDPAQYIDANDKVVKKHEPMIQKDQHPV